MPPTADNAIIGIRTSVSLLTSGQSKKPGMRGVSIMADDSHSYQQNGLHSNDDLNKSKVGSKYDFFYKESCLYSQKIYKNAARVFQSLKHETREELENPYYQRKLHLANTTNGLSQPKVCVQDLDFADDNEKRLTFQLAYETLKYQRVFEDLLLECSFFTHFPEYKEDESLVYVVLWDYQSRKFQARTPVPGETTDAEVQSVEEAIIEYKTKLNASLARHRIKASAPSIEFLLPDKVRSKEEIVSKTPVYIWVNLLKTTVSDVISQFKDAHYAVIAPEERLEGRTLYIDPHCSDVIVLPSDSREYVQEHDLLSQGHIVMQDKSSCIAPQSIKYLVGDDDDVIHVNAGSGVITAHLASAMHTSSAHIFAFGTTPALASNMEKMGVKNVKEQSEQFLNIETDDNRFKNVKVVLVTADCTKSGITNPIDFVVNEGEDMKILKYLSLGETDETKLGEMIASHGAVLRHAMKLSKVQAIVYMTRSINESENEHVVSKAVEQVNTLQQRKFPWRVVPPVLPFSGNDIEKGVGIVGKFVKFSPSEKNSGCFVAVITREPEDVKEAHKDILERARAQGLLGGKKKTKKPAEHEAETEVATSGDDDKLLERRVKHAPRKLRTANSFSTNFNHAASIVKSQIYTKPKTPHRHTKSLPTLTAKSHIQRVKELADPLDKKEKPLKVAEHVKVVKHPAPFRRKHRKNKKK
ncbi:putative methyltransferase NSUN7 isoform X1 [Dreissena polymorpha]|uniref:putative methyltransferase NSUN7 isoform X1 n=1 Tax=Dreissena polymorpha TaxID=45954 RepID=UPI0022654A76|nr:putative methyltransferase NSUN7 isoform X1 [Dreissena polymorpha]XP_052276865.1 putative methyltransferase NSUN7 isoform X1 [Dreissena polymorpha]XP_052276866.1 putative methyltransferase NSUN7 isoform X1 [Dreissena polymorpha]XP_052276867.1 putative methyltransferase NSUN7 isoform X1 [Dreissena polymorpha]XP_052276868.1 putative methyltransferase NSUN7 isoform X1 [Dreissena polymorpha]XP_052276869.1 putative methyltransferase NSUN7 isoform X1 [Dreissena polymorpha]XP_052276871.1 putative